MIPLIAGAIIGAGANLLGQGINAASTSAANRAAQKFQMDMYNRQRSDALSDWERQNQYNSPLMQMQRYKEAGLNPNLIYGQMSSGATVRASSPGNYKPDAPQFDLGGVIRQFMELQMQSAQISNQEKLLELREKELEHKDLVNSMLAVDKQYKPEMAKYTLEGLQENVRNTEMRTVTGYNSDNRDWTRIKLFEETNALQQQETKYRIRAIGEAILTSQQAREESRKRIEKMGVEMGLTKAQTQSVYLAAMNLIRDGKLKDYEIKLNNQFENRGMFEKITMKTLDVLSGVAQQRLHR